MNKISGVFNLKGGNLSKIIEKKKINPTYCGDNLFFVTERISDSKRNQKKYAYNKQMKIVITFIGEIKNFSELCESYKFNVKSDIDLLMELYRIKKDDFVKELNGLFTLVIYNLKKHELYIYQDVFSSPINLYYCVSRGNFLFSTSLKRLLLWSNIERELNEESVINFLKKSCIPTEHTLIKDINKLVPGQYLKIKGKSNVPKIKSFSHKIDKNYKKEYYIKNYYKIFRRSVKRTISSLDEINMALSSGYDSNFLLYTIRDLTKKKIISFTMGGKEGRDERKNATQATKAYENIEHQTQIIDGETLKNFPEIIWRQEDLVCLPSNFVKLQLSKLAKNNGCRILICGDCCDEILQMKNKVSIKRKIRELILSFPFANNLYCSLKKDIYFSCNYYRAYRTKMRNFEYGPFRILKHAGIMMNSFSIELRFPYLDKEFVECASKLKALNKESKIFHIKFISQLLPNSVVNLIKHLGGRIDENFMFKRYKDEICGKFKKSDIAKKYIGYNSIEKICKEPMQYMNFDLILKTLYLDIFQDIFISGDYDYTFEEAEFSIEFDHFLVDKIKQRLDK